MAFNTNIWTVEIEPGYVYVGRDEYYLYANKQAEEHTASGGVIHLQPQRFISDLPLRAPVVITDVGDYTLSAATSNAFAKTYEYRDGGGGSSRTPHRYRRRYDLTGKKDIIATASGTAEYSFSLGDHEFTIDYGTPNSSGYYTPTITINPSNAHVIVEYEDPSATGLYRPPDIDMNPIHTPRFGRAFIVVTDEDQDGGVISAKLRDPRNLPGPGDTVYFDIVYQTRWGRPLQGRTLALSASPSTGCNLGGLDLLSEGR